MKKGLSLVVILLGTSFVLSACSPTVNNLPIMVPTAAPTSQVSLNTKMLEAVLIPEVDKANSSTFSKDLATVKAIIEHRLNRQSILDYNVTVDEVKREIILDIPWDVSKSIKDATYLIKNTITGGKLYFQEVKLLEPVSSKKNGVCHLDGDSYVKVGTIPLIDGKDVDYASTGFDKQNGNYVEIKFNRHGQQLLTMATTKLANNRGLFGVFLDGTLLSAPTVAITINSDTIFITGKFTEKEVADLSDKIRVGKMPIKLNIAQIKRK